MGGGPAIGSTDPGAAAAVIAVPSMAWFAELTTPLSQLPALGRRQLTRGASNMTEALASKTCTPCRGGIPPLTREQAELFHAQAPDWQLAEEAHRIERSFRFRNFREALTFVQEIGELAEAEGHHPNISFGWGNATVSLQTKKIKGLHENDFIMATKIDCIFARTATA
jgi:4a-hydroxytetrahydrobiopterin dehydratase